MNDQLFSGLKVLDIATVIAAPVAATILADFGAEVIKVEQPIAGDMLRLLSEVPTTPDADNNYFWQMDGRNKKSLTLNLKSEKGMEILHRLIKDCDVFINNQPFTVRRSLKTTYEDLKPLNPSMIYASLSAFGETGPDKDKKAFDMLAYWARSGLMDLVRSPGAKPVQSLPGMGDHPTAIALYASIVTALLNRERTGEGSIVHTSLLANGLWSVASIAQGALAGGDMAAFHQRMAIPVVTGYVYQTCDERYLQITMIRNDEQFHQFLAVIELPTLLNDPLFATEELRFENREILSNHIQQAISVKSASAWMEVFTREKIPIDVVASIEEAVLNEQLIANNMIVKPQDPTIEIPMIVNHPINVSNLKPIGPKRAPDLGEHSAEILLQLGYSENEIQVMKHEGVI